MKYHNNKIVPKFSFYKAPVTNTRPLKNITLADAYRAITSDYLKEETKQLRSISEKDENRVFKSKYLPYITFSGKFSQRNEQKLIQHSGLIAIDFDHLENVMEAKYKLLTDKSLNTELLFISPNGNGLKWIISIGEHLNEFSHKEIFLSISNYIKDTYSLEIDKACKDISRATFLCYDPECWIRQKHLVK